MHAGGISRDMNGLVVNLVITREDLNRIKQIENLFVSSQTSYLSFSSDLIVDMNRNPVVAIPTMAAMEVATYINDTSRPQVTGFDLDMNRGIISVYFLETINIFSVNYSCFSIQASFSDSPSRRLTGGELLMPYQPDELTFSSSGSGSGSGSGSASEMRVPGNAFRPEMGSGQFIDDFVVLTDEVAAIDTTAIFINITLVDLNAIKSLRIGEDELSSWLTIDMCAIRDQNDLPVVPRESGINAVEVRSYIPDTTRPELQQFDLDMNLGLLTLRFSETVVGATLDVSMVTLQAVSDSQSNASLFHTLNFNSYIPGVDYPAALAPELIVQLRILDLNELKQLILLATSANDTYISITMATIADTKSNPVVPISSDSALLVKNYTVDTTRPNFVSFDLDLNINLLTLTFDETVSGSSLQETEIILQQFQANFPGDEIYRFVGSPHDEFENTVIRIFLSFEDRNALKQMLNLATRPRNTWIVFSELLITDTSSNPVIPVPNDADIFNRVINFVPDMTPPHLTAFSLNISSSILSLTFSKTVSVATINLPSLVIQNSSNSLEIYHRLSTDNTVVTDIDSAFIDIRLSLDDLNNIKMFRELATTQNNTYISLMSDFIEDTTGISIVDINITDALQVTLLFNDVIHPELNYFDLDLTAETLTLVFTETVDATVMDFQLITIQEDPVLTDSTERYSLTGGVFVLNNRHDATVVIRLTLIDLNAIKTLFNLAVDINSTFISFPSALTVDLNFNEVVAIPLFGARQVRIFRADSIDPFLTGFELNLDSEVLDLSFSETINIHTFNLSQIIIQGVGDPPSFVQLTSGEYTIANDSRISVNLSTTDINNFKRDPDVAVSQEDTNIAFLGPIVQDTTGNFITIISSDMPLGVSNFTDDSMPPVLDGYELDLNTGILTLVFDETVNVSSLDVTSLTFQSIRNQSYANASIYTLTTSDIATPTNEPVVIIELSTTDLNAIKRIPLCTSPANCFLSLPMDTVRDMNELPIQAIPNTDAMSVFNYTFDTTPPRLVSFSEINLNNATVTLEFDETVNVNSIDFTGFILQNFFRNAESVFPLIGGFSQSDNGTVVIVELSPDDIFALKEDDRVCSRINNCWIQLVMNSIRDMNGNGILAFSDTDILFVQSFIDDTIRPFLIAYNLDMNEGVLSLTFSEPVLPTSLNPVGLTIRPSENSTLFVRLTQSSTTSSGNGPVIDINLSFTDLSGIKATEFAKSANNTFLTIDAFTITDIAIRRPNRVVPIVNGNSLQVSEYIADITSPQVVSFTLDLSEEIISLTFNEPVRPSTLDVTEIALQSAENTFGGVVIVPLTSGSVVGTMVYDGVFSFSIRINRDQTRTIKLNENIGTGIEDTFLTIAESALTDMAGNYVTSLPVNEALPVFEVIPDTSPATLDTFTLDMNTGEISLTFTDVVVPATLRPSSIQIQDDSLAATSVTLTEDSYTNSSNGNIVKIILSFVDLNAITYDTALATDLNNTFITVRGDAVRDLQGNDIVPITDGNGQMASGYVADITPAQLLRFALDVNTGELRLDFSETVNVGSLNVSSIILLNMPTSNLSDVMYFELSAEGGYPIGSQSFSDNGSSIVISLGSRDLNELKRLANLGTSTANTYIAISSGTISDMVSIGNAETPPINATRLIENPIPDITSPELVQFSVDLTVGSFYLTFSETVNASSLNVNGIIVQNSSNTFLDRVRLNSNLGSQTTSFNAVIIQLDIGRDDLNDIKRNRYLTTSLSNVYLFVENYVIADMAGNLNVPIYNPNALQASNFTEDLAIPFLLSFDIDLNTGELLLTFDETIESSSVMVGEILLQNVPDVTVIELFGSASGSGSGSSSGSGSGVTLVTMMTDIQSQQLVGGPLPLFSLTLSEDDPIIVVSLGEFDLNEIKRLPELATSENNSFISFTFNTAMDMNNNNVLSVSSTDGVMATKLVPDSTPPVLRTYDLDMNLGQIIFTFDETVNAESLNGSLIVLQEGVESSSSFQLTGGRVLTPDSTIVVFEISTDNLNYIKQQTNLATNGNNAFLRLLSTAVSDTSGIFIEESNIFRVSNFTMDTTAPNLVSFDLDMNALELTLVFDETVNTSSLNVGGILLQEFNDTLGEYYILTDGSFTRDTDSTVFTILLSRVDANEIKRMTSLAIDSTSVFIGIQRYTITDMNGNLANAIPSTRALPVSMYTVDETRPNLEQFHLDLDANELILTFDETVNIGTLVPTGVTFHNQLSFAASTLSVRLTGGTVLNTDHSHIVRVLLVLDDINSVKLHPDFGTNVNNTFLSINAHSVIDLSFLNPNGLVATSLQASLVIEDHVSPVLNQFAVDLNLGELVLYFNEPVNTSTFDPSGLTVQDAQRSRTGVVLATSYTPSGNGEIIIITLSEDDLNEIKRIDALFVSAETSYITIIPALIQDMNGIPVAPIINGFALQTVSFIPDTSSPAIARYSLDMNAGNVILFFSETVNASSFDCTQLTFASSMLCNVSYSLTGCYVDTTNVSFDSISVGMSGSGSGDFGSAEEWTTQFHYNTYIRFELTLTDLNSIKALDIARSASTTYLSYTNRTILDQNDRPLLDRNCTAGLGQPIESALYTPDLTSPEIVSFNISIDSGMLILSFTETVRTSTLQVGQLTLHASRPSVNDTSLHTLGLDARTRSFDGPTDIVTIYLAPDDLNRIKFLYELAISANTTFLAATQQAVVDTKGNPLIPIESNSSLRVFGFEADTTPPALQLFVLDVNLGQISLTFDETVNISTLSFAQLTIQAVQDLSIFESFESSGSGINNATNDSDSSGIGISLSPYQDCEILFYQLMGGSLISTRNDIQLTFGLTLNDLNSIKREPCLASSVNNTYLSLEQSSIEDMNENGIDSINRNSSFAATNFVADITSPSLIQFDLNMTSEILTLYFDETVNASSFDPTQITIAMEMIMVVTENTTLVNSTYDPINMTFVNTTYFEISEYVTTVVNYTLTGGELLLSDDPVLYLTISLDDLNNIKALTALAINNYTSFLSISNLTVQDMNSNFVNSISEFDALRVNIFTEDVIRPVLNAFDINLDTEQLILYFSETVNVSSLMLAEFTVLSDSNGSPVEYWNLAGGGLPLYSEVISPDQPTVVIQLGYRDINEIKRLAELAISNETTYLSITSQAVLDMNMNNVVPVSALPVQNYTPDTTPPQLVQFHLDLDIGLLTLEYSETVNASSLQLDELTLQNHESAPTSSITIYNSTVLLADSVFLYIDFGFDFFNELKQIEDLATNNKSTFISFPSTSLVDMNNNSVVPVSNTSATMVTDFIFDSNRPELNAFDLDMNLGILTLYFNETIRVSTLNTSHITLSQFTYIGMEVSGSGMSSGSGIGSGSGGIEILQPTVDYYTLMSGIVQDFNSPVVTVMLTLFDLNQIKKLRNLATSPDNTHILLTNQTLDDMYDNDVVPIVEGMGVASFIPDTTPPDVHSYTLDVNRGLLIILFTETVDTLTLNLNTISFYNSSEFSGLVYTLISSTSLSNDGPLIEVILSQQDLDQLKFIRGLGSNDNDTYLFLNSTVLDMVGNEITPLYNGTNSTRPANIVIQDTTPPVLNSFNFDLNVGQLSFTFSEVVDDVVAIEITFQSKINTTNETSEYTLTGGTSFGPSLLPIGPGHPPIFTINISSVDLNAIKALRGLAISNETTYLSISSAFVSDTVGNAIISIPPTNALLVTTWSPDVTNPTLSQFSFSADSGILRLTFDETVAIETFNTTFVQFVNSMTGASYTLTQHPPQMGAVLSLDDSPFVQLTLSNYDLNMIKIITDLATELNNTYLFISSSALYDTRNNSLDTSNMPLIASSYEADMTNPELITFDLDMNADILTLYFSESVNISSLYIPEITLQSENSAAPISYTFLETGGTSTLSSNGPIIVLNIGQTDSDNIKQMEGLATVSDNTFISVTNQTVLDMVNLPVVQLEPSAAIPVQMFVEDRTNPILLEFEFDLDNGVLTLTFDETVNVSSIDNMLITLQDATPTVSHMLTMGGAVGINDPVVTVPLEFFDLNQVKKIRTLATTLNNTYINVAMGTIRDMVNNPSEPQILLATNFTDDTTSPQIETFMVDLNASLLILNFDEPVDRSTFNFQQITLQSSQVRSTNNDLYHILQGGTSASPDGLSIRVLFDIDDLNEIKRSTGLLVNEQTSWISFTAALVSDMRGNPIVPVSHSDALQVDMFQADATRPHLVEYHLDMDASLLHLTFLETVNSSSINFTAFTLQAASELRDNFKQYRLQGGELASYNSSTVVTVIITLDDLNELKSRMIGASTDSTWLVVEATGINDKNGLPIVPLVNGVNALQASMYTVDTTRPILQNFTLNLNTGEITFSFSETVRARQLNLTHMTLLNGPVATGNDNLYMFTSVGTQQIRDWPIVTVAISVFDLNEIKSRTMLATGLSSSFLSVRSSTVFDMQMNFLVPIPNGDALQATSFISDTTRPALVDFSLDMDSANLTLTFNEPVNASTLIASGLNLYNPSDEISYTLGRGFVVDCFCTVVVMNLNDFDDNLLKIQQSLCTQTAANDCYLNISVGTVMDTNNNINDASSLTATSVTPDETLPYLVYFDLDLTAEELRLTFSEVVEVSVDIPLTIAIQVCGFCEHGQ